MQTQKILNGSENITKKLSITKTVQIHWCSHILLFTHLLYCVQLVKTGFEGTKLQSSKKLTQHSVTCVAFLLPHNTRCIPKKQYVYLLTIDPKLPK